MTGTSWWNASSAASASTGASRPPAAPDARLVASRWIPDEIVGGPRAGQRQFEAGRGTCFLLGARFLLEGGLLAGRHQKRRVENGRIRPRLRATFALNGVTRVPGQPRERSVGDTCRLDPGVCHGVPRSFACRKKGAARCWTHGA